MILSGTLPDMELTISLRELAGSVVRDEMARQALGRLDAARKAKMAPSTLNRVINGEETVGDLTLRQVEGALHLPRRLLTFIIDGDEPRIRELDMDTDLRTYVLASMIDIKNASAVAEKAAKRGRRR